MASGTEGTTPAPVEAGNEVVNKKTTSKKSARKRAELRKRRSRARRLAMMILLTVLVAAAGVWTVTQVWYTTDIPAMTVVDKNMNTVEGVAASGSITGWGLAHQQVAAPIETMGESILGSPTPSSIAGLPQAVFFLLLLGLCALIGGVMRQAFVTGVGVVCGIFSWNHLGNLRDIMENPNFGGAYNTPGQGLLWFQTALAVSVLLSVLMTAQVAYVNAERRRKERARAKRNGEAVTPTLFEVVHAMTLSQVSRFSTPQGGVKEAEEEAGSSHLDKKKTGNRS